MPDTLKRKKYQLSITDPTQKSPQYCVLLDVAMMPHCPDGRLWVSYSPVSGLDEKTSRSN